MLRLSFCKDTALGSCPRLSFIPFFPPLSSQDGKKKGDSSSGSGGGSSGGSSRPPAPQEDTASEAGTPQGEAQARDDGDEEGLLTHSEEELVRAQQGRGWQEGNKGGGASELVGGPVSSLLPLSLGF